MGLSKYILLGIISGIFNMYPLSYSNHINIYKDLFNTKIFLESNVISILNIGMIISILLIYSKDIILFLSMIFRNSLRKDSNIRKQYNRKYMKYILCMIITMIINIVMYFLIRINVSNNHLGYLYIVTSIILLLVRNNGNKKDKDISYIDAIIIGLSSIIIVIPSNSILLGNLLGSIKCKLNKKTSLRYSLTCQIPILFLDSINGIIYFINDSTYLWQIIVGIIISIFVSLNIYKSLKYMYYTNKMYRLALYTLFFAIFIFYWFI